MISHVHANKSARDIELSLTRSDPDQYPNLLHLIEQKYGFVILKRRHSPRPGAAQTYLLACQTICSNGTELLHRYEHLTPECASLQALEDHVQSHLMNIMQRHFFGRDRLRHFSG